MVVVSLAHLANSHASYCTSKNKMLPYPSLLSAAMASTAFAIGALAHPGHTIRDCEPVAGSFYLTGVPADGSATYPIYTALESRGVQVLSSASSYFDQWTYNT